MQIGIHPLYEYMFSVLKLSLNSKHVLDSILNDDTLDQSSKHITIVLT